jgi:hypothetical protein
MERGLETLHFKVCLHEQWFLCRAVSCDRRHADRIGSNLVARHNFIVTCKHSFKKSPQVPKMFLAEAWSHFNVTKI